MYKNYIKIGTMHDNKFVETESLIKLLEDDIETFTKEIKNIKNEEGFNEDNYVYNRLIGSVVYMNDLKNRLSNLIK